MRDPVLIVVDNGFERRYYYSAGSASSGLGWLVWPDNPAVGRGGVEPGVVKVYRLDEDATATLAAELLAAPRDHDPRSGRWLKHVKANFEAILQRVTGIR